MYTFSEALQFLKDGVSVVREGWNGKNMFLTLQKPDENSKMSLPYIYISVPYENADRTVGRTNLVPWVASQTDLLADDWKTVEYCAA